MNILTDPANRELQRFILHLAQQDRSPLPQIMEKNYCYNLGLEDYARLCRRSLSSFKRDFQKYYGKAPGKWLVERRLERARSLLLSTAKTVQEICYESGFENSSHFSRKFKAVYGVAPLQYRSEHRLGKMKM